MPFKLAAKELGQSSSILLFSKFLFSMLFLYRCCCCRRARLPSRSLAWSLAMWIPD